MCNSILLINSSVCHHWYFHYKQECYSLLQKHDIAISHEELERVDTVQYLWQNLHQQVGDVLTQLLAVQGKFKATLMENVEQFQQDSSAYVDSYNEVHCMKLYVTDVYIWPDL